MPLYDYDCTACGRRIEVVHGVHAPSPTHCPTCGGGPLKKAITAPAVHFRGSGWAKKERRATVAPGVSKSGEGSSDSAAESAGEGAREDKGAREDREDKGASSKDSDGSESSSGGSTDKTPDRAIAAAKSSSSGTGGTGTATKTD